MYCAKCGAFIQEGDRFCIKCGAPAPSESPMAAPATPAAPAVPWQAPAPAAAPLGPPPPTWAAPKPGSTGLLGIGNPVMAMGAIIFIVLGVIASIVATGLSWEEAYGWAAGIYLLSAVLFLIAGLFFYMGKRTVAMPR